MAAFHGGALRTAIRRVNEARVRVKNRHCLDLLDQALALMIADFRGLTIKPKHQPRDPKTHRFIRR
jgi:hypothetical protein